MEAAVELVIVPGHGVGPVRLGMTRDEVHGALGAPDRPEVPGGRLCFLDGLLVDFDQDGRVEFIEMAKSPRFRALLNGVCLHEVPAEEAIAVVARYGPPDESDPEFGYSYTFPEVQMCLWRPTLPEPGQSGDDGRTFEAVGVAADGYFTRGR